MLSTTETMGSWPLVITDKANKQYQLPLYAHPDFTNSGSLLSGGILRVHKGF